MKLKAVALLLFCVLAPQLFSGSNDSLIKFSDLVFKNDLEKNAFKNFLSEGKKADVVNLFLTHYIKTESFNSALVHQQIIDCVSYLKKETNEETEEKKIKIIYKYVHQRFFKIYKRNNSFSDVFEKGEYNCVSGSAMYAIVFQMMNIPYQIVEAPNHVFLFAYPNTHKIMIETTSPKDGYFTFTDAYVSKYINYLYEGKLIGKEEYDGNTADQLFNKYYFLTKGMSVQELAAIQYANYAAYYLESNENEKALAEIKKAYFINPGQRMKYILQSILWSSLTNCSYKEISDVNNLLILCRQSNINSKEVSNENIKYEFGRVTQEQLINNSGYIQYDKSFELIYNSIADSTLKNDIAFHYHYELCRLGYLNNKDDAYEFPHLKAAYDIKQKHADLQNIIKSYFARIIEGSSDINAILKLIGEFEVNFDFLMVDPSLNVTKANCFLELSYQNFMVKNVNKGELYLYDFEKLCSKNPGLKLNDRFVEKAYSTAASYYFKKGNKAKTRELLKTGIRYAPENFGLKIRLEKLH